MRACCSGSPSHITHATRSERGGVPLKTQAKKGSNVLRSATAPAGVVASGRVAMEVGQFAAGAADGTAAIEPPLGYVFGPRETVPLPWPFDSVSVTQSTVTCDHSQILRVPGSSGVREFSRVVSNGICVSK